MILSDFDLRSEIMAGRIVVKPSSIAYTPNGLDLSAGEIMVEGKLKKHGCNIIIPPLTQFFVSTLEKIELQSNMGASLHLKTKWARQGVVGSFGFVDAGFKGTLNLTLFNASKTPLTISEGNRIVQIVFHPLSSRAQLDYAERSGHYQGQEGITLEPKK